MSFYPQLAYDQPDISEIKGVQFSISSPDAIKSRSVAHIHKSDAINNNQPVPGGLYDARMGVIDFQTCPTCFQTNTLCPGHFGHVELAQPIFHVHFLPILKRILRCVCTRCSKILVNPESSEVQNIINKKISHQKKFDLIYNLCTRKKSCGQVRTDGCGTKVPKITRENIFKIGLEWKSEDSTKTNNIVNKQILTAKDVLMIMRRISDYEFKMLGFDPQLMRPEWMICTVLPVPPPSMRPSVRNDTGMRQEDDLTHMLSNIIKLNNTLYKLMEKGNEKGTKQQHIDIQTMLLQLEVANMIDNTQPGIPSSQQRNGRKNRSVAERLRSKEGRIRGNLMGKRVDFSGRSVITGDPNIAPDQLGVPYKVAMNLTFPEVVNQYNKEELMKLVNNGPDIYPGAKTIKRKNGATYRLKSNSDKLYTLEQGDVVERHLRNDDVVLFNRQPTLHRMSMMSHRVIVMPYNTFRINATVTPAYNAD